MSGHRRWSEIKHKRDQPATWTLVIHRTRRPWWGLGLIARTDEVEATKTTTEEEALSVAAMLKAEFPKCDIRVRRP